MATTDEDVHRFHPIANAKFSTLKGKMKDDIIHATDNVIKADDSMWQILKNAPDTCHSWQMITSRTLTSRHESTCARSGCIKDIDA